MPIYAYRCSNCGHAQDALQRLSDPVLTVCPACGQATYVKQVTAAGFQLKGSGWYVTDFRGDGKGGKAAESEGAETTGKDVAPGGDKPADAKTGDPASKTETKNGDAAKAAASAPVAAPAASPAPAAPSPAPPGKTSG